MKQNETDAIARRIPVYIVHAITGEPITGLSFAGAEVQLNKNGGAWANGTGTMHEVGGAGLGRGAYYYAAVEADTSDEGYLELKVTKADALEYIIRVTIGAAGELTDDARRIPVLAYDVNTGALMAGLTFGAGELLVSVAGAAWANAAGSLDEVGGPGLGAGSYSYEADPAEVPVRGFVMIATNRSDLERYVYSAEVAAEVVDAGPTVVLPIRRETFEAGDLAGDLGLTWSNTSGDADLSLVAELAPDVASDLDSDRGLMTAVLLSLFVDRRAEDDDRPPSGDARDRRGWWADQFSGVEGDRIGSRLWLLDRAKRTNETKLRAKEYVLEALAWMIEDRVVASIDVEIETSSNGLGISVGLQRPGRDPVSFRFAHAWDHLQESA